MEKIENIQQALDLAIRNSEGAEQKSGYEVEGREYPNYLSNDAWENFLEKMSDEHREQFEKGSGGELEERRGRWGLCPPHMASFGSSSRFVYNLLKSVSGIEFEKKLPTRVGRKANKVGGEAHLDAYIKSICEIFIEAKCHEIYSSHNSTEINECYEDVFKHLARKFDWFECRKVGSSTKTNYSKYSFYYNDKQIKRFDIKQLICHFLAISAYILESGEKHNIKFIYLIFNPNSVVGHIDKNYKQKILDQYEDALEEISLFNMEKLFEEIFEFQKTNRTVQKKSGNYDHFEFVIADQNTIEKYLK